VLSRWTVSEYSPSHIVPRISSFLLMSSYQLSPLYLGQTEAHVYHALGGKERYLQSSVCVYVMYLAVQAPKMLLSK
jgi:hypothetical protein